MRIAFLIELLGPHGGTEAYVRAVGEELLARGHRIDLLYERDSDLPRGDWQAFLERARSFACPAEPAGRHEWMRDYLNAERPDVLFVQNLSDPALLEWALEGPVPVARFVQDFRPVCLRTSKVYPISRRNCHRALGIGCLFHACSIGPAREGGRLPISWNGFRRKLAEREMCRRLPLVVVASDFMRRLLIRNGFDAERTVTIPMFPPMPVPPRPTPFPANGTLLYLGQIERFKGLAVLLSALRALPPSFRLRVAGEGPWQRRCEALAREWGLEQRVTFLGWVPRSRIPDLFRAATAVVVPSLWNEPFGLVGLEAMAHARPVVAFDVGGIPEWLEDGTTGLLVREHTPQALARALYTLCADRDRMCAMGVAGYRRALEQFSLARHVDRLLERFGSLEPEGRSSWRPVTSA